MRLSYVVPFLVIVAGCAGPIVDQTGTATQPPTARVAPVRDVLVYSGMKLGLLTMLVGPPDRIERNGRACLVYFSNGKATRVFVEGGPEPYVTEVQGASHLRSGRWQIQAGGSVNSVEVRGQLITVGMSGGRLLQLVGEPSRIEGSGSRTLAYDCGRYTAFVYMNTNDPPRVTAIEVVIQPTEMTRTANDASSCPVP